MSGQTNETQEDDALARWHTETLGPVIGRVGERREQFTTDVEGFDVKPLYTAADTVGEAVSNLPGEPPFTRGIYPSMYRSRLWTMRQYAGMGTAAETNERFRYLIDSGSTGLSLAFDLPTQRGYDSDAAIAAGEVGRSGVAIDTIDDMARVFDGIDLGAVSTSMTINAPAGVLLAMYVALGDAQGVDRSELRGTIQNDILKEYIARNLYIYPPADSLRLIADTIGFCAAEVPRFNPISISGYHIREAGSTAVQEVGFTFANAITYLDAAEAAGLDIARIAPRISFFFSADSNLLEEVAKFRAARQLWASLVADRYGVTDPAARRLRFHTQTAGSTLTAQQVDNNIVRVAYQALAAVLGGTQSLHTNGKDEALALPTEQAVHTALRTQQILAEETGVADTVDPLGGSYYIESLTTQIDEAARELLAQIETRGGMLASIEAGWVQRQIQDVAFARQAAIDAGDRTIVGVNAYTDGDEAHMDIAEADPQMEAAQVARLEQIRAERDAEAVDAALEAVASTAASDGNLMPPMITAVKARATVGEISNVLREVFGEYRVGR
ncbi:MAG: methylmalonyl-CoA mutase family protein [Haloquadratum sp.]|jgi:methylmalonyl-CoA mutase N-terminal domain/subunit|nr:methylmalonyl-CoA mutase family protein [Haloferacaceae archaeon]MDR9444964.1 methylmalonyl-CoA mutase family protein [Haloquadratum sp.]